MALAFLGVTWLSRFSARHGCGVSRRDMAVTFSRRDTGVGDGGSVIRASATAALNGSRESATGVRFRQRTL